MTIPDVLELSFGFLDNGECYGKIFWYNEPENVCYTENHSSLEDAMNEINNLIDTVLIKNKGVKTDE